jgi:hypothetical protein
MNKICRYLGTLFTNACLLIASNLFAQHNITLNGDTLILNNQEKFWINKEIILGTGTMPDGTYSYIYEAPNNLQKLIKDHRRKLLPPGYKGYKSKIVKFEKEIGQNKKDYNYTVLVLEMPDGRRYWCELADAFSNREIVSKPSENNNIAEVTKTVQDEKSDDVNEKLVRLKKLLDKGEISQQEYDLKKQKLLDSQKTDLKPAKPPKPKKITVF